MRAMSVVISFSHLRARSFGRLVCQNIVGEVLAIALEPGGPCRSGLLDGRSPFIVV
jgi:hypothetical protein